MPRPRRTHRRTTRAHGAARRLEGGFGLAQSTAIAALEHDEHHAVQDEHGRHGHLVVEVLVHQIVEQEADDGSRDAADGHHAPQTPRALLLDGVLLRRERVQLVEVQDEHGHDGAQLDDHEEQGQKLVGHLQLHELVHEDHMAGRGDGQPFGDALHDADEEGLQCFDDHACVSLVGSMRLSFALMMVLQHGDGQKRHRQAQSHENELGKLLAQRDGGKGDERHYERRHLAKVGDAVVERGVHLTALLVGGSLATRTFRRARRRGDVV